ncbi:hypothetical protein NVV32_15220 [Arthrobacter sp. N1]
MIQAPVFVRDASAVLGRMVVGTGFQNGTIMSDYAAEEERQRCLIEAAMTAAAFVLADVGRRYVETGGHADLFELEAYLGGLMPLPVTECNLLARALNELIDEEPPLPRAPSRPPLRVSRHRPALGAGRRLALALPGLAAGMRTRTRTSWASWDSPVVH